MMRKTVIALFAVFLAAAAYYFLVMQKPSATVDKSPPFLPERSGTVQPEERDTSAMPVPLETTVDEGLVIEPEAVIEVEPLPALAESDPTVLETLGAIAGQDAVMRYLVPDNLISRLVATIDALNGRQVSLNLMPINPLDSPFEAIPDPYPADILTNPEGDELKQYEEDPANYARYTPYVELIESMDMNQLAEGYRRYEPLFQEAYVQQGFPKGNFTARLIEIIDLVLAAPAPPEPLRLVKPEAYYKYVDPEIEALPAGQKILVRMGNSNADRVKVKLREFRGALVE